MSHDFSDWVGRSITREDIATPRLLAEYRATMVPHLFEPADQSHCPPGLHWGLAPATPGYDACAADGSEARGSFLPPIPLPRRMWAGGSIETLRPIRAGQQCSASPPSLTSRRVMARLGRCSCFRFGMISSPGATCLSANVRTWCSAMRRRNSYCHLRRGTAVTGDWIVEASPLLLFRFSAFTFNGHRIHYDAPYAAEEGYPGLVVHGPLQAALMLNLAAARLGPCAAALRLSLRGAAVWRFIISASASMRQHPPPASSAMTVSQRRKAKFPLQEHDQHHRLGIDDADRPSACCRTSANGSSRTSISSPSCAWPPPSPMRAA